MKFPDMHAPDETIRSRYNINDKSEIEGPGGAFGKYFPEQRRLEWDLSALGVDQTLIDWVSAEAALWDNWAHDAQPRAALNTQETKTKHNATGWLKRYPELRKALQYSGVTLDMAGKTVLDIGGSGKDLVYWLAEAPARIDQVEVSARSQFLCLGKLARLDHAKRVPVFFHTVPAEHLPFDNGMFDYSSLHPACCAGSGIPGAQTQRFVPFHRKLSWKIILQPNDAGPKASKTGSRHRRSTATSACGIL